MPFTVNQFFDVFARYNLAVWPAQLFLYALAIFAIYLAIQRKSYLSSGISYFELHASRSLDAAHAQGSLLTHAPKREPCHYGWNCKVCTRQDSYGAYVNLGVTAALPKPDRGSRGFPRFRVGNFSHLLIEG